MGYNNRKNNDSYNNKKSYNNDKKKHSGCKLQIATKGNHKDSRIVTGWKYGFRSGMLSLIAGPYKGSAVHKSKTGQEWVNYMLKITNKSTMQTTLHSCLFSLQTHKVICKELGIVMNPKAPNGGYVGKF